MAEVKQISAMEVMGICACLLSVFVIASVGFTKEDTVPLKTKAVYYQKCMVGAEEAGIVGNEEYQTTETMAAYRCATIANQACAMIGCRGE